MTTHLDEVILTHEHTDFDALASLFAAALLFPGAQPLLPYQLNRNVQDFFTLYKDHFPFIHLRDWSRRPIARAILVDTRTVNYPRGMNEETPCLVIDHHSLAQSLPPHWQLWSEAVGANTTLLVEKLSEQQISLTPVQATLLALGIYEDTGSLTFGATTYRDALALAWLLEPARGANLEVIMQFLRHPLSEAQRHLLEMLISGSEFLDVAGHTVVIAQAEAPDFVDELSTLAHRLRDIHEADAIFLLVGLGDIVQMVARSITDDIDVGAVARQLGGGGHVRAAAAPIHQANLQEVYTQISVLVRRAVQPALTVRQIMSVGRPQTLSPNMTIHDAAILMRRYGHEGFPVLESQDDGSERLLGVLTRREVDRAINHKLGHAPVHRFMQAGQVTVRATDSISTLRKTMVATNWGQVPVVDDQDKLIGIVTRTDLIKLWDEPVLPARDVDEIDQRLRATLSPTQFALLQLIGRQVDELNYRVYVVGGFVRDLLLNGSNAQASAVDMDIVIEGDAIAFAQHIQQQYGGRIVTHKRFGTAKWLLTQPDYPLKLEQLQNDLLNGVEQPIPNSEFRIPNSALPAHLDFVTARTEFYTAPTVLPTVELSNIKLDLHRRDFTINTLAISLNPDRWGELLDFYGGLTDLKQGVVRVLHSLSFVDDPTRILRAVRYEQRFSFQLDPRTLELMQDALDLVAHLSAARLRHELERLLQEAQPEKGLTRLADLGVLAAIHPDLAMPAWLSDWFVQLRQRLAEPTVDPRLKATPLPHLYWALLAYPLSPATLATLQERLHLENALPQLMADMLALRALVEPLHNPDLRPSQVVALLDEIDLTAQALFRALEIAPAITPVLTNYATRWRQVRPILTGRDLAALGLPSGPRYAQILRQLRTAKLDGLLSTRDEELAYVAKMESMNEMISEE